MKLLFCQRNLLMQRDMEDAFHRMGISFRCASYVFSNTDSDDFYCSHLRDFLNEDNYDAVFSFNFLPLIADVCHEMDIPYLSWTYDAGWEFRRLDTLFYDTNYLFHFDRRACEDYRNAGYAHVFHMPLAVNCTRLDATHISSCEESLYTSAVTFVGSLYEKYAHTLPPAIKSLPSNGQQLLLNYIDKEASIYANHRLWDSINPTVVPNPLTRFALLAGCSAMIAGIQRETLLSSVTQQFPLTLYTTSPANLIPNADYRWRVSYYSQMPIVFRHATVNLNLTIPSIQTGLPLRILDILGAGGFLLTNKQAELSDYFSIGKDLDTFESLDELTDKLRFYLAHPDYAAHLAENGHNIVKEEFSFEHQFKKMAELSNLPL